MDREYSDESSKRQHRRRKQRLSPYLAEKRKEAGEYSDPVIRGRNQHRRLNVEETDIEHENEFDDE